MNELALQTPEIFFRDELHRAAKSLNLTLDSEVEFYLVNLLCEFISPQKYFQEDYLSLYATPLALTLKKALESPPDLRLKTLKRLGDFALYIAGFFQDFFKTKTFDVSYYIAMGSLAYQQSSELVKANKNDLYFTSVFKRLSQNFPSYVNLVTELAPSPSQASDSDLLNTYIRWQATQSPKLLQVLEDSGIKPFLRTSKQYQ